MDTIRTNTCLNCKHATSRKVDFVFCDIESKWISYKSSQQCQSGYEYYRPVYETINGYMIKNQISEDYRTEKQWLQAGYRLKENAIPISMYASKKAASINSDNLTIYYSNEDVEKV